MSRTSLRLLINEPSLSFGFETNPPPFVQRHVCRCCLVITYTHIESYHQAFIYCSTKAYVVTFALSSNSTCIIRGSCRHYYYCCLLLTGYFWRLVVTTITCAAYVGADAVGVGIAGRGSPMEVASNYWSNDYFMTHSLTFISGCRSWWKFLARGVGKICVAQSMMCLYRNSVNVMFNTINACDRLSTYCIISLAE